MGFGSTYSYCEFTDSNWVWFRVFLVLQGVVHKSIYPAARLDYRLVWYIADPIRWGLSIRDYKRPYHNQLVGVAHVSLQTANGHSFGLQTALTNKWAWLSVCLYRYKWA